MIDALEIRESRAADLPALEALYPAAFPEEDLLPLLRDLLKEDADVLSLVGMIDDALVGHVVFTLCGLAGAPDKIALLGPLAVTTERQRQGIGSALVHGGFARMKPDAPLVCVLGDPAYYGRFGFVREDDVAPPYALPDDWRGAWQSLRLSDDAPTLSGTLVVPAPWRHKTLWAPDS